MFAVFLSRPAAAVSVSRDGGDMEVLTEHEALSAWSQRAPNETLSAAVSTAKPMPGDVLLGLLSHSHGGDVYVVVVSPHQRITA